MRSKFGLRNPQGFGTVKSLFISPECLEGLSFNATLGEAQKLKVVVSVVLVGVAAAVFLLLFPKKTQKEVPLRWGVVSKVLINSVQYLLIMADVLTKKQRSYNMSKIKGRNTKPEISLRKLLVLNGIRGYRLNYKLIGKPDIVFSRKKVAIFIDGCFWHKCRKCFVEPETRKKFWTEKINGNVKRDKEVNRILRKNGWKILRFWEHEIKNNISNCVRKIENSLLGPAPQEPCGL